MTSTRTCSVCGETKDTKSGFKLRKDSGKYRPECRACHNKLQAARRYGLSLEEYTELELTTGNRCGICKVHADDAGHATFTRLVVDHDHRSGTVRGFLCARCNIGLGQFDDSVAKLQSAITYLTRP